MLAIINSNYHKEFSEASEIIERIAPMYNEGRIDEKGLNCLLRSYINSLPESRSPKNWTGFISKDALDCYINNDTYDIQCEHEYPKQIVIPLLFTEYYERAINPKTLESLYFSYFGRFNLVTRKENLKLVKYQKPGKYTTPKESYKQAGIELVDLAKYKDSLFDYKSNGSWWKFPIKENIKSLINNN